MKRIILILAFAGVMLSSCQKNEFDAGDTPQAKLEIVKTLSVSDAEWTADDAKSSYVAGTGIALSGTEAISVFYADGQTPVAATPQGNEKYIFSHADVSGAETYDYNYLMPHSAATKADGTARLFAVQFPEAGTYDPDYDFLLGQSDLGVPKAVAEVSIEKFKRLSAPFNFVVIDECQLLGGESAKVVTVDFPSLSSPVAADFVPFFSSEYSQAGISATVEETGSTALTAVYPDGLAPANNEYNVWFSSLPASMLAGQVVSLTISTESKTLTCKAVLPADFSLRTDMINKIPFRLSRFKTDYANVKSNTTVYASETALPQSLIWPSGYVVSSLKVYATVSASVSASAELVLKSGDSEVMRKAFSLAEMNGGCVEFDGLDSYSDLTLSLISGGSSVEEAGQICAVTTLLDEPAVPEFTFPERLVRCGGEDIVLPCTAPSRVTKVSLVGTTTIECAIKSAADQKLTVTIPENAPQDIYDVKVEYPVDGISTEEIIGTFSMALDAGDYYKWDNVTIYAQNHTETDKVFCLETGMMASIQWVKDHEILINMDNPGSSIGTMGAQPRGYHYLMLRGENSQLRIINPNANNYTNCFTPSLTNYGLPQIRFSRIEKEPYKQNTAYPEANGGNTTHTPQAKQIALYDAITAGSFTSAQWNALASEFGTGHPSYPNAPNQSTLSSGNINLYGHTTYHDMRILFDNYSATVSTTGTVTAGTAKYWNSVQEARDGWTESFHGGVVLWTANYGNNGNISWANAQQLNGAMELISWTGEKDKGATMGSITMRVFRKKTWEESHYSYDTEL